MRDHILNNEKYQYKFLKCLSLKERENVNITIRHTRIDL